MCQKPTQGSPAGVHCETTCSPAAGGARGGSHGAGVRAEERLDCGWGFAPQAVSPSTSEMSLLPTLPAWRRTSQRGPWVLRQWVRVPAQAGEEAPSHIYKLFPPPRALGHSVEPLLPRHRSRACQPLAPALEPFLCVFVVVAVRHVDFPGFQMSQMCPVCGCPSTGHCIPSCQTAPLPPTGFPTALLSCSALPGLPSL